MLRAYRQLLITGLYDRVSARVGLAQGAPRLPSAS
jgi:hypothetical protein